jgi:hypothetical protein
MTKLSKARQEEAASAGIIPLLKKVIKGTSRLDQFALPIFCELANAGKVSRRLLWKNNGLSRSSRASSVRSRLTKQCTSICFLIHTGVVKPLMRSWSGKSSMFPSADLTD